MLKKALVTKDNLSIYGNNHVHPLVYWYELSEREQRDLDYLDTDDKQDEFTGFRYKGNVYDLSEFMRVKPGVFPIDVDGYASDSFFNGVLVKYTEDGDGVLVYTYIS